MDEAIEVTNETEDGERSIHQRTDKYGLFWSFRHGPVIGAFVDDGVNRMTTSHASPPFNAYDYAQFPLLPKGRRNLPRHAETVLRLVEGFNHKYKQQKLLELEAPSIDTVQKWLDRIHQCVDRSTEPNSIMLALTLVRGDGLIHHQKKKQPSPRLSI